MNPLHQLVKNKSVSLVGPSDVLLDTNLGKRIDESDVVIRMGAEWPGCCKSWDARRHIGERTDVVSLHTFERLDTKRISQMLDLKLVVWFLPMDLPRLVPCRRYLRAMEITEMQGEPRDDLWMITVMYLELLKTKASRIFVCGWYGDCPKNCAAILSAKDKRVEFANHMYLMAGILI